MPSSIVLNGTTGIANATWTTGTRPASPVAGQSGYNTTIGAMETYTGSTWSTSDLPAPSTAGNVLTSNGTSWTSQTPATPNVSGGATSTTGSSNITLTASSNRVQYIAMTAANLSVTLPDATTLSQGGPTFVITNTGAYSFSIKVNSGAVVKTISAADTSNTLIFFLVSNSTSDGVWTTEDSSIPYTYGTAVTVTSNLLTFNAAGIRYGAGTSAQPLTSTTALVTWCQGTSGRDVYGAVLSTSGTTITVGTATLIYSGSSTARTQHEAHMLSSTAGFVYVQRASNIVAVPITISGTTITVGTASSTYGAAMYNTTDFALAGYETIDSTTALVSYRTNATPNFTYVLNTITHNGASAPTLGTASASMSSGWSVGSVEISKLTATTYFVSYINTTNSSNTSLVATTSGTSAPTLGTGVTTTTTLGSANNYFFAAKAISSTQAVIWNSFYSIPFTISGTTVTAGTAKAWNNNQSTGNWNLRPTIINTTNFIGVTNFRGPNWIRPFQILSDGVSALGYGTNDSGLSTYNEPNDQVGSVDFVRLSNTAFILLSNNQASTTSASTLYAIYINLLL